MVLGLLVPGLNIAVAISATGYSMTSLLCRAAEVPEPLPPTTGMVLLDPLNLHRSKSIGMTFADGGCGGNNGAVGDIWHV